MSLVAPVSFNEATVQKLLDVVRRAGAELMQEFGKSDLGETTKSNGSPVLRADKLSHELFMRELPKIIQAGVVSEESSPESLPKSGNYFIVDPLDGTKAFRRRDPDFAINLALDIDGQITFAVIYGPAAGQMYYAIAGQGAFYDDGSGVKPITVANKKTGVGILSVEHIKPEDTAFMERLGYKESLRFSSSLKFCHVASGQSDFYVRYGNTMLWDTAAADLIVREAGGRLYYRTESGWLDEFVPQLTNTGFVCSSFRLTESQLTGEKS